MYIQSSLQYVRRTRIIHLLCLHDNWLVVIEVRYNIKCLPTYFDAAFSLIFASDKV